MTAASGAAGVHRPDEHHPSPQLARAAWHDLDGTWQFAFDDAGVGMVEEWQRRSDVFDRTITVPFPFESPASGIGDTSMHRVVWYRREVLLPRTPGHRILLHFGAVDYRAHVWVNGRAAVYHEGGHTPFAADISQLLDADGSAVIVVRAEDSPTDLRQPRGKQGWHEHARDIWYDRTTGIWQTVWWEEVPDSRIRALRWMPDVDHRSIELVARFRFDGRTGGRHTLRVLLHRNGDVLVDDTYALTQPEIRRRIAIDGTDMSLGHSDLLWSPENPQLIDAVLQLRCDDEVVDEVHSYTALRSVAAQRDRVLLNGRPYFLKLVLAQNFWPASHLAAPNAEALRQEVQLVKELGFNGVRLHQKVEDPRFLAWCDRLGLLVWAELPAAYEFSPDTISRLTREWLEILDRDLSHPCIVTWVPVNESWGVPALERSPQQDSLVRSLFHLTRAVDPSRLVIGNDGWEQAETDILTVHDYTARGAVLRERYGSFAALEYTLVHVQPGYRSVLLPGARRDDKPVVISEFGGISYDPDPTAGWRGYGEVRSPEQLVDAVADLVGGLLASPALAGFCWTQLTDTQQERNGLLTADRVPKVPSERIRAVIAAVSASVAGDAVGGFEFGDYVPGAGVPPGDDG